MPKVHRVHKQPKREIKIKLNELGISQAQAALDLDVSRPYFNAVCQGWDRPGPDLRRRIAEYLGMPEKDLF